MRPLPTGSLRGCAHAGMAVDVVYDGGAALDAVAQTAYDVVVLDRDLPVVHGDRVCREVAGTGPRVLMLTAADEVEDRVDGLERGADDYLGNRSRSPSSPPGCGR